ncbi:MAG TPA: DUF6512 family protein [Dermatophilaceae bacterium]
MARRLAWAGGIFIVVAGTLAHFVYSWSGERRVVGRVSPVNESVWEYTKLVVVPVLLLGGMELRLLRDRRRVVWAPRALPVATPAGDHLPPRQARPAHTSPPSPPPGT